MSTREIDPEHNWFWQQGYNDGFEGRRVIPPDETRHWFHRSDYFAGHDAGDEDRAAEAELIDAELIEAEPDHEDYGDVSDHLRFVNCDVCHTEGVIERSHSNAPDPTSVEICPACKGELVIAVEVEPSTEDDI